MQPAMHEGLRRNKAKQVVAVRSLEPRLRGSDVGAHTNYEVAVRLGADPMYLDARDLSAKRSIECISLSNSPSA